MSEYVAPARSLHDHVGVLRRRITLVVAITAVAALAALVVSLLQPVRYTASATVLVPQEPVSVQNASADQLVDQKRLDPQRMMQDELRLASSSIVREEAAKAVGAAVNVSVSVAKDADVLTFTGTGDTAEAAARSANATAEAYVSQHASATKARSAAVRGAIDAEITAIDVRLAELADPAAASASGERTSGATGTTLDAAAESARRVGERDALLDQRDRWLAQRSTVDAEAALRPSAALAAPRVIDVATPPSSPSSPTTIRNVILAALGGFLVAIVAAYAVDALDDRIRDSDGLERQLGLACVGRVDARGARGGEAVRGPDSADDAGSATAGPDHASPAASAGGIRVIEFGAVTGEGVVADALRSTGPNGPAMVLAVPISSSGRDARRVRAAVEATGVVLVGAALTD